ncbi:hypothetical protein [Comamonas sp. NLF-1-9]|uniref:hypothetical protein n=1 Tax=Comamonas sp. NLF-1-9 TaxID=2853163 RepID=UPI001C470C1F|nr:hypothetical protein [Comamonas sp. NLF-1-9]QXL84089.1 hypothetical protein KUD94_12745 [Comamonas sp. NLF-1-9]
MTLDTSVKRIHESMRGAPTLKRAAGTGVGLLDAFLVDGWGLATATSASVSGGVCTIAMGVGNEFEEHCVVLVAGATPGALNGEHRLTQGGANIQFETTAPDGAASGTITVKYAPLGWEKVYTATNKRVYRSQDVAGNRRYLRVNDTAANYMRVYGYNAMTAIETGTGNFGNGLYWHKATSDASTAEPQRYDCFGDARLFFFAPCSYAQYFGAGYEISQPWCFGEPLTLKTSGDAWNTLMTGDTSSAINGYGAVGYVYDGNGFYAERVAAGTGSAVQVRAASLFGSYVSGEVGSNYVFGDYPDAINGKLRVTPIYVTNSIADMSLRATMPGALYVAHTGMQSSAVFTPRDTVPGEGGRRLMHLFLGVTYKTGAIFFDITGPWR